MGRFTVIPEDAFNGLQLDAGVLLRRFNPASPEIADEDIICATTGGINPVCKATFSDFGADVDNVPNNMKEFKHLDGWDCSIATTSLGTTPALIKMALGCADIDSDNASKIVPRRDLKQTDFSDIWWVGDKADGGFVAIQLKNALSTEGFSLQTTKNGKGQIAITIMGHVSIKAQKEVPMIFYSADPSALSWVGLAGESPDAVLFGVTVSDLQENIVVSGGKITGTLKYLSDGIAETGPLSGAGNFIALKFSDLDANATSVMVGLDPSQGTGLVEIINDPDKNGVFKVTANTQKFKIVSTDGTNTVTQTYDLSDLVLEEA